MEIKTSGDYSVKFSGFWAWLFLFGMIDLFLLGIYLIKLIIFGA